MTNTAPAPIPSPTDEDFTFDLDLGESFDGATMIDLISLLTKSQYEHLFAARYLTGKSFAHEGYAEARAALDEALLHLSRAKYFIGTVTGSQNGVNRSRDRAGDARRGVEAANKAIALQQHVRACLAKGETVHFEPSIKLDNHGTECLHADGVPITPSICPIVVVSGSSYDMGYQYAQQVLEIYGDFVFKRFAEIGFTEERLEHLRRWEAELTQYTPDVLDMVRGWADGATDAGIAMSYEHVLHLWTSADGPDANDGTGNWPFLGSKTLLAAMYFGQQAFLNSLQSAQETVVPQDSPVEHCSGFAAWGDATKNGQVIGSSSTDHDCWMQATILAYPDDGHAFIYTPFSVCGGWIPGLGISSMAGHPGMNNKGLAYCHHGGELHRVEPPETWSYGVPRGAQTFHSLQHFETADQVFDFTLAAPISAAGSALGSPGGQWADKGRGISFENRHKTAEFPQGHVREGTYDHDGNRHDLLYSGNSALHADLPSANHGHDEGVLDYDIERGWHTYDVSTFAHADLLVAACRMTAGPGGAERHKTFFQYTIPASGQIDADWAAALYRTPPQNYPAAEELPQAIADALSGKRRFSGSPAHRGNAFTAVIEPDNGDQGLYSGCIGPLRYDLPPNVATHGYFYYDETNVPWTVRLASSPDEVLADAIGRAQDRRARAEASLSEADLGKGAAAALKKFLAAGDEALQDAEQRTAEGFTADPLKRNAALSKALRQATRAQVRFGQIIDAIDPPKGLEA